MSYNKVNVNVSGPKKDYTSTYKTYILRGNMSFADQVTEPNVKYVVKYDFDLDGGTVTIPEDCLLEFDGGSVSNGTIEFDNTILIYNQQEEDVLKNITMVGDYEVSAGGKGDKKDNINGMGKIYLKKNKGFAEQLTQGNTIYVIQYDFDLGEEEVTIPENCVLEFDGGSLINGKISAATNSSYRIVYHSGKGIMCDLDNDFNEVHASWFGMSEDSDPEYNRERLQMICSLYTKERYNNLRYGMPMLIVDVPKITVSRSVEVPRNLCITSSFDTALLTSAYPLIEFVGDENESVEYNSGFLYNSRYSSSNDVSNICIKSRSHCFNFENEASGSSSTVFYSAFKNLLLYSEEGSCIYKKTGTASVFSCVFENIDGNCPNGSVIDGAFSGLNLIFDNIRVIGEDSANPKLGARCANSVFNNCCGIIQNCNVGDKNIGGFMTFDGNLTAYNKFITIKNCNIEQINGGVVVCNDHSIDSLGFNIALRNVSILFYSTEERGFPNGVDFDIISVPDLRKLEVTDTILPVMATGYYFARTWKINDTINLFGNKEYNLRFTPNAYDGSNYSFLYNYPQTKKNIVLSGQRRSVNSFKDIEVIENLIVNNVNIGDMLYVTGYTQNPNTADGSIYIGTHDICKVSANSNVGVYSPWSGFIPRTNPTKKKVKLINISDYYIRFTIGGAVFKLNPLEHCFINVMGNSTDGYKLVVLSEDGSTGIGGNSGYPATAYDGFNYYNVDLKKTVVCNNNTFYEEDGAVAGVLRSGTTANRPVGSSIYLGFMYFDTDEGKPIYASAISGNTVTWVDATGATV